MAVEAAHRQEPPPSIRQIERRAAAAWPASITEECGGWLLRHSPGVGRQRCNSALPPVPYVGGVERVERFYGERDMPTRIQVSPAEYHGELDASLASRGYRRTGETSVLTAATEDVAAAASVRAAASVQVGLTGTPGPWLGVFAELDGHDDSAAVGEEVLSRIASPAAFLSVVLDGRPRGMGLFVAERGWAGVFCMATAPGERRRGVATAVLGAGARWARDQGAARLYLQVERDNEAAVRLYTRAGFTHSHTYHYRIRP
ncbi:GNAT family N-acetyltransferase [Streptosporangium sp. NPDC051022]|uniref:GNAT family N-acetyltransferase n=1 Tax=Streptosporangium sp. NPDC051022 TaxID=3155752 RepID=UPI003447B440